MPFPRRPGAGNSVPVPFLYVYSGADASLLNSIEGSAFERFGFGVAGDRDIDVDGVTDYVIGAPGVGFNQGRVVVISGADGSTLWSQFGPQEEANLGSAVTGLGDLNGDGVPEQAVGAVGIQKEIGQDQTRGGEAFILNGADGSFLRTLEADGTAKSFGNFFVHAAGDVDGDGVEDVYVGDFGDVRLGPVSGRGYVYSGAGDKKLRLFNAENAGDGLGIGRGAGDQDGDGRADLLLGAFLNSDGAPRGGKCYLHSGKNGQTLRTFTLTVNSGQLGFDVAVLGDVDGDGLDDFLLTGRDLVYVVAGIP